MNPSLLRAVVALVFAALLAWLARGAVGRPLHRRSYALAAGAMLAFAALNATLAAGVSFGPVLLLLGLLGLGLLLASVVTLLRGMRSPEMQVNRKEVDQLVREFKEPREQDQH